MMEKNANIFVAGAETMIGAALVRALEKNGYENVSSESDYMLDLTDSTDVTLYFDDSTPDYVFVTAGKSGGIAANQKYPADLITDNLMVSTSVIQAAFKTGVKKLLYLASSCSYPKNCPQPMREEALLSGPLEPTNEAYAVSKIAGIKLCQSYATQYGATFISGIPANAFGPDDDFDTENSHVIAALLRRMHEAKASKLQYVELWGTGTPRREFIFVDDLADACILVMQKYKGVEPINLGCGTDLSIAELAEMIKEVVGFEGKIVFNSTKPDGMSRKILESNKLKALGWKPKTNMRQALGTTYRWYLEQMIYV